ncbi:MULTISPECIES: HAD family hydrolase [Saccharibacillus]|uniref:HAD family phosphatase n=1 Tax=Saccharibacillus brassicae TaxID=2583377 RepID=A0A4Y6V0V4_SACBS|nr:MULTISPECIES: HAD family phosphatase [Saccharibacillus]MWJ32662.1 HAD-IA family hydrolase [Saccharibacillus sp. WB 17]QDH22097.1 HAD family phosphatase [Saccharibacillus brassicae]
MIEAFIFDMDGVIIDSEPLHFDVDRQVLEYYGHSITQEQLEGYVGMTNPEFWSILRGEYGMSQTVEEIIEYQLGIKLGVLHAAQMEPIPGIRELLAELRRGGIPRAIASSSPRVFIEAVLDKFGLQGEFDFVVSSEEVPRGKPSPDVYLRAAELLGADPARCVVLEDARHGIAAAKAAGMACIGYVNPNSGNQDLTQADLIVDEIGHIRLDDLAQVGKKS